MSCQKYCTLCKVFAVKSSNFLVSNKMKNIFFIFIALIYVFNFCDGKIKLTNIKYACTAKEG